MNIQKKFGVVLLGFLLAFVLLGCSNNNEDPEGSAADSEQKGTSEQAEQSNDQVAATVNGDVITVDKLEETVKQMKQTYTQQGIDLDAEENKQMLDQLKQSTLDQLISMTLLTQAADNEGIEASEKEIDDNFEQISGQFESEEQFDEVLQQNNLTVDILKDQISTEIKINKFINDNTPEVEVTEDEMKQLYDQYSEQNEGLPAFEEMKGQLRQELETNKREKELAKIIDDLKEESDIEINV